MISQYFEADMKEEEKSKMSLDSHMLGMQYRIALYFRGA